MMRRSSSRLLIAIGVLLAIVAMYWFVLEPVQTSFLVVPGGQDVVVRIDGSLCKPSVVSADSNLYDLEIGLHHGKHVITVRKPGYKKQTVVFTIDWDQGEAYPNVPDLTPLAKGNRSSHPPNRRAGE
ncbi:MAG: hypothetical protein A2Z18_01505 [Armatimonadetes bacterium RBG_16_58_9]|nr:MAG: hypothetical protein A2Z18_01505 [Armatimonadetes bacterium RBG_16_58_9]